jgi:hypothetical protein
MRFLEGVCSLDPSRIKPQLRVVQRGSLEERLFRFWNLAWWSIPYQRSYGRQMRFLIWDAGHDAPLGLVGLHSPPLRLAVRDTSLGIPPERRDWWANMSLAAQRVGALPPYNELLGGKMAALTLAAREVRETYEHKYAGRHTLIAERTIPAHLLFVTTTGAFGKASIYNRVKYGDDDLVEFIGYTQGSGAFHIPDELYDELLRFLRDAGVDVARGYGHGPSRKRQLLSTAFRALGLPSLEYHGLRRAFYLVSHAHNLRGIIQEGEQPVYKEYSFADLASFWKERWALPRSARTKAWRHFSPSGFKHKLTKDLSRQQDARRQ